MRFINTTTETFLSEYRKSRFDGNTGSSPLEVTVCVLLAIFYNICTTSLVNTFLPTGGDKSKRILLVFICEFFCCVFSIVISLTYLSEHLFVVLSLVVFVILALRSTRGRPSSQTSTETIRVQDDRLACVSDFRGMVNLYSVICILAADFPIFPKRFLKTESYGFSLMDTGVGLFVVALALASSPSRPSRAGRSAFLKHFVLLALGVARYLSVSSLNYPHQVFEYGVHWNFFITLAAIGLFNELLFRLTNSLRVISVFSCLLLGVYEFALHAGLRAWLFGPSPRDSFFAANREGICSLAGYEVLYLWGVLIKSYLPKKGDSVVQYRKARSAFSIAYAIFTCILYLGRTYFPPSRRCANFAYILWITSISLIYLIIRITYELDTLDWKVRSKCAVQRTVPFIVESVNFNGLLLFLLGNLLTGLINLCMYTMLVEHYQSLIIITLYAFTCCSVTSFLYAKNWRIR